MTIPLNMRTVNVILIGMIMLFTVACGESVFDKSRCEEMSCDQYPVRTKQKQGREEVKTCREKEGGKLTTTTTTATNN